MPHPTSVDTHDARNNHECRKIWDISPAIDEHAEVFPGDTAYSQLLHFSLSPDCPVNVNRIMLSPHTGAHADAPLHYATGHASVGELDLAPYLGPCRVIHCLECGPQVEPAHIAHALADLPARVLLRTARTASQSWASFTAVALETLVLLATKNIALIGIDTPSVDPATSQHLPSHQQLLTYAAMFNTCETVACCPKPAISHRADVGRPLTDGLQMSI